MELSQTSVAGRKKRLRSVSNSVETNNTSNRTPAASPELAPCQKTQGPRGGGEVQRAPRAGEASVSNHFHRASPTLQRGNSFLESGLLPLVVSVNWNTSPRVVALTLQHVESPPSVWRIPVELVDCKVSSYLLDTTRFCITYTA